MSIFVSKRSGDLIRQIYPKSEADRRIRKHGKEKSILFSAMAAIAILISIPVFIHDGKELKEPVEEIDRGAPGSGTRHVTLNIREDDGYEDTVSIDVNERIYSDDELAEYSLRLDKELWEDILAGNESASYVTGDLDLKDHIYGFPFDITWKTDTPQIMNGSGIIDHDRLLEEDINNEGVQVLLCATCRYKDYKEDKMAYIELHSVPKDAVQRTKEIIERSLEESDTKSRNSDKQLLPEYAGDKRISFYKTTPNRGWAVLFTGFTAAFILMASRDRKIKDKAEERRRQIDSDYPNIVNQYALYYTAGMNPRAIWYSICNRYKESPDNLGSNTRYAYEEMLITQKMMEDGCGELAAYDEFATRCQSIRYRSFVGFIKQSVIKGTGNLDTQMAEELETAQREKNNQIRLRASEAETKLLLPMFMMLAVVLAIVMIPAFISIAG